MGKCVVSGCPNREANVNRGIYNRAPKRFFNFPKDPARVKVWLAALRETDKQDSTEQHLICEDHFLPEDISTNGVNSDAIPIMPPCLDGPLISPWGAESSEEEDQWATGGGCDDDDDDNADEGVDDGAANVEPPAPELPVVDIPQQEDPDAMNTSEAMTPGVSLYQKKESIQTKRINRTDVSLGALTQHFLELILNAPDNLVDLRQVTTSLQTRRRRVYDITNVLEGISLVEKQSANKIKWIGSCQISNFLWKNRQRFERELENLKLVEETLDTLIKGCAQQLFDMTDDLDNAALAYVTCEDISRVRAFEDQTVIVVKAPEETKLEVPAPKEDSIQVHLKGGKGPIMVVTCEVGAGGASAENGNGCLLTLEESRIKTATLHTESSSPQSAVQSA